MYLHQESGIQYHQESMMSLVNAPSEIEPIQATALLSQPSLYGKTNCYKNMQWDFLLYVFMK
jgi:hypothetical protein